MEDHQGPKPSLLPRLKFAALILLRERLVLGLCLLAFSILTSLATRFIKQHVIADVVGGYSWR